MGRTGLPSPDVSFGAFSRRVNVVRSEADGTASRRSAFLHCERVGAMGQRPKAAKLAVAAKNGRGAFCS